MFDNPYIALIFLGLFFKAAGFLVRDELLLRVLVFTGTSFDILFYMLQSPAIWGSVMTNAVLVVINLILSVVIARERSNLFMTERERRMFKQFKTLSPGQFRCVNRWARWHISGGHTVLLREGERSSRLFYIDAPYYTVQKQGQTYTAAGPAFVGEITFLQGGAASATVFAPKGAVYAQWCTTHLHTLMHENRALGNALVAQFGHDLANKVRYSAPLPQHQPLAATTTPASAEIVRIGG